MRDEMNGRWWRVCLSALLILTSTSTPTKADGNIGCLFSETVCTKSEELCYDDFAFGKCISIFEDPDSSALYRESLNMEDLEKFEKQLKRLVSLGFGWEHAYTQCVLQRMLLAARQKSDVINLKECEPLKDPAIVMSSEADFNENSQDDSDEGIVRESPISYGIETKYETNYYHPALEGDISNIPYAAINRDNADNLIPIFNIPRFKVFERQEKPKSNSKLFSNEKTAPNVILNHKSKKTLLPPYTVDDLVDKSNFDAKMIDDFMHAYIQQVRSEKPALPDNNFPEQLVIQGFNSAGPKTSKEGFKGNIWYRNLLMQPPTNTIYSDGGSRILPITNGDEGFKNFVRNYGSAFMRRERLDVKKPGPRLDAKDILKKINQSSAEKIIANEKVDEIIKADLHNEEWFYESPVFVMTLSSIAVICVVTMAISAAYLIKRNHDEKAASLPTALQIDAEAGKTQQETKQPRADRVNGVKADHDKSPSARSSTSSWSEEPALTNMDISTGHMVLAYMEDHLKNKDRLEQEWKALCAYEAEPCATTAANKEENLKKNRYPDIVPYDHSRVLLNAVSNKNGSDYINASSITDHDPRNPAYIAAAGPLENTAADFWQLIWEQGSVVTVLLTRLQENGNTLCYRYWPEEGSCTYHIYEVHLVSEHIWCDDYLVRSFYLKNQMTGETRTVTQFHFLSWPDNGVPASTKALLEFRRKVNKSYRGRSCPIVVHCSDGAGRTGTYCLIDMVLNRMAKGAKEIDIAATLEHIRDQRPNMVATKQQFEFVLMAVAEEVHAILKALPAQLQPQEKKETNEK